MSRKRFLSENTTEKKEALTEWLFGIVVHIRSVTRVFNNDPDEVKEVNSKTYLLICKLRHDLRSFEEKSKIFSSSDEERHTFFGIFMRAARNIRPTRLEDEHRLSSQQVLHARGIGQKLLSFFLFLNIYILFLKK